MLAPQQFDGFVCVAEMRYHYAAADDQGYIEGILELFIGIAGLDALDEMIVNAVIAAKHRRGHQSEELLGSGVKCSNFIGRAIQTEEALDAKMPACQDLLIHLLAMLAKLIES
jgi:hypothetical protein